MHGWLLTKDDEGQKSYFGAIDDKGLPDGEITLSVEYSTINYKDGLAFSGKSPVVRQFPMVPGIDGVGTFINSTSADIPEGSHVVINGWGLGETRWGCLADKAVVQSHMTVPLPKAISAAQSMQIGTAGYTAMLCVQRLLSHGLKPEDGPIMVTGAAGGVGSFALMFLSALGFHAVAITGRANEEPYLKSLGAAEVRSRDQFGEKFRPLEKEQWMGAIDTVGSKILAHILAGTSRDGCVAACGLAQGADLPTSVMPFILRGVTLAGVDSVMIDKSRRLAAWELIEQHFCSKKLDIIAGNRFELEQAGEVAQALLHGDIKGRALIKVS
jgi:acrylyl-CoA reductase (NADPH)